MIRGVILCCLSLLLTACTKVVTVPEIKTVVVTPPESLFVIAEEPQFTGKTNNDLLKYAIKLQGYIEELKIKIEAIHSWALETKTEQKN